MKKTFVKILSVVLLVVCLGCVLAGCAKLTKENLVGRWKGSYYYDGNHFEITMLFNADGTYRRNIEKNGISTIEGGTYVIEDNEVTIKAYGEKFGIAYEYDGDCLGNNNHKFYKD